ISQYALGAQPSGSTQSSGGALMPFSRISGTLIERAADAALIDAGGLGYEIVLPPCVAEKIPAVPGAPVTLEIYSVVNIDGNAGRFSYYGFTNAIEREFFEALIS